MVSSTRRWFALGDHFEIAMILTVAGAIFGAIVAVHYRFMRVGKLNGSPETL